MTTLLREVPRDSPVHRLWAGTKIVCVAVLGLTLSLVTSWVAIGLVAVFVVLSAVVARVPPTALPRLRPWFYALLVFGGLFSVPVGLDAVLLYVRLTVLGAVLLIASLLLGATTALGDVAPALARLGTPLRLLRVPVDEWAVAVALCVRAFPLLVQDVRVLAAARRLRRPSGRRSYQEVNQEVLDLMVSALATSMRRAGELGEAITARGGTGRLVAVPGRPGAGDAVAVLFTAASCTLVFLVG